MCYINLSFLHTESKQFIIYKQLIIFSYYQNFLPGHKKQMLLDMYSGFYSVPEG